MARRALAWVLASLFVAALTAAAAALWASARYRDAGPLPAQTTIILPPGIGVAGIAARLQDARVIDLPWLFAAAVRLRDDAGRLQAGEYAFPARVSMQAAIDMLVQGRTVVHRLAVPEGLTVAQVLRLMEQAEALAGEVPAPPAEGSLLPDTYHYTRDDQRQAMIERMQGAMRATLAALWPQRAPDLPLASPEEAVVLASIVERETAVDAERPLIAGVFYNRLARGMRLQSDPTVVYAASGGLGRLERPLTRQDLQIDDPYNTYLHAGLPPGPIANPGRAALEAVLHPAPTEHLYFVADGNGGHAFAPTLAEHNRNVRRWRDLQKP
jgi:UPF0755 protein